jgi:hypothetical protein
MFIILFDLYTLTLLLFTHVVYIHTSFFYLKHSYIKSTDKIHDPASFIS